MVARHGSRKLPGLRAIEGCERKGRGAFLVGAGLWASLAGMLIYVARPNWLGVGFKKLEAGAWQSGAGPPFFLRVLPLAERATRAVKLLLNLPGGIYEISMDPGARLRRHPRLC